MSIEIVKRGAKFFLVDSESGETVGDSKGYPNKQAAQKAMTTLETAAKLPKSASLPRETAAPAVPMPPMPMMGGAGAAPAANGMSNLMEMLKSRGA